LRGECVYSLLLDEIHEKVVNGSGKRPQNNEKPSCNNWCDPNKGVIERVRQLFKNLRQYRNVSVFQTLLI